MRNVTKVYVILALAVIALSPLPSLGQVAVDKTYNYGILDESMRISASMGQRLHIEITDSAGSVSLRVADKERGYNLKLSFSDDAKYIIEIERAVQTLSVVFYSLTGFSGNIKIYVEGTSPSTFYQLGMGLLILSLGSITELLLRRPSTSPYLHDEDKRVSPKGLVGGIVPFYLLAGVPSMSSTIYRYEPDLSYAPDLQFKDLFVNGTQISLPLIVLLIVLTYHLSIKPDRPSPYSVYPIDARRQYIARIMVHLSVLFALSAALYSIALFNGEYSGTRYVWMYILAYIASFVALSLFVLLQVLITDFVRVDRITPYLFPISILIYIIRFSDWNIPVYHLLGSEIASSLFQPSPYLWFYFVEVIVGIAATVYLNLRLRKSNGFVAN